MCRAGAGVSEVDGRASNGIWIRVGQPDGRGVDDNDVVDLAVLEAANRQVGDIDFGVGRGDLEKAVRAVGHRDGLDVDESALVGIDELQVVSAVPDRQGIEIDLVLLAVEKARDTIETVGLVEHPVAIVEAMSLDGDGVVLSVDRAGRGLEVLQLEDVPAHDLAGEPFGRVGPVDDRIAILETVALAERDRVPIAVDAHLRVECPFCALILEGEEVHARGERPRRILRKKVHGFVVPLQLEVVRHIGDVCEVNLVLLTRLKALDRVAGGLLDQVVRTLGKGAGLNVHDRSVVGIDELQLVGLVSGGQ